MADQSSHDTFFDEFGDDKRQRRVAASDATEEDFRLASTQPFIPVIKRRVYKPRKYSKSTYLDLLSNVRPRSYKRKKVYVPRKYSKRRPRRVIKPVARVTCSCSVSHSSKRYAKSTPKRFYRKR